MPCTEATRTRSTDAEVHPTSSEDKGVMDAIRRSAAILRNWARMAGAARAALWLMSGTELPLLATSL